MTDSDNTEMTDSDNTEDEIITVRLPRAQYETLRRVLKREEVYSWIGCTLKSHWIWIVAGGVLSVFSLWETIKIFIGVK